MPTPETQEALDNANENMKANKEEIAELKVQAAQEDLEAVQNEDASSDEKTTEEE